MMRTGGLGRALRAFLNERRAAPLYERARAYLPIVAATTFVNGARAARHPRLAKAARGVELAIVVDLVTHVAGILRDDALTRRTAPKMRTEAEDQPIVGHRLWRIVRDAHGKALLASVVSGKTWKPGRPMEGDPEDAHRAGVHAFKARRHLGYYGVSSALQAKDEARGTVALWGKIVEHDRGWRSEFAYPVSITTKNTALARELRRTYGCDDAAAGTSDRS